MLNDYIRLCEIIYSHYLRMQDDPNHAGTTVEKASDALMATASFQKMDREKVIKLVQTVFQDFEAQKKSYKDDELYQDVQETLFEEEALKLDGTAFTPDVQTTYLRILPVIRLSKLLENNERPEFCAFKLAMAFGSITDVKQYLERLDRGTTKLITDATQYELPIGRWNPVFWREMAKARMGRDQAFKSVFPFARQLSEFDAAIREADSPELALLIEQQIQDELKQQIPKLTRQAIDEYVQASQAVNGEKDEATFLEKYVTQKIEGKRDTLKNALEKMTKQELKIKEKMALSAPQTEETEEIARVLNSVQGQIAKLRKKLSGFEKTVANEKAKYANEARYIFSIASKSNADFVDQKCGELETHLKSEKNKAEIKERILKKPLAEKTSKEMLDMAFIAAYENGYKDIKAAKQLIQMGVPEPLFNFYLDLKHTTKIDSSDTLLPDILLTANACEVSGDYYLQKVSRDDPKAFFLGYPTGCCQSIGSPGGECAIFGSIEKNGCFYIIVRGKPPYIPPPAEEDAAAAARPLPSTSDIKPKDIVAVTFAWRNTGSDTIVFDNIEWNNLKIDPRKAHTLYIKLIEVLAKKDPTIKRVTLGRCDSHVKGYRKAHQETEHQTLSYVNEAGHDIRGEYEGYSDARSTQTVLFHKGEISLSHAIYYPEALQKKLAEGDPLSDLTMNDKEVIVSTYMQDLLSRPLSLAEKKSHIDIILSLAPATWFKSRDFSAHFSTNFALLAEQALEMSDPKALNRCLSAAKESENLLISGYERPLLFRAFEDKHAACLEVMMADPHFAAVLNTARANVFLGYDETGTSALHYMIESGYDNALCRVTQHLACSDTLIRALNNKGETPLKYAVRLNRPNAVEILLRSEKVPLSQYRDAYAYLKKHSTTYFEAALTLLPGIKARLKQDKPLNECFNDLQSFLKEQGKQLHITALIDDILLSNDFLAPDFETWSRNYEYIYCEDIDFLLTDIEEFINHHIQMDYSAIETLLKKFQAKAQAKATTDQAGYAGTFFPDDDSQKHKPDRGLQAKPGEPDAASASPKVDR